MPINQNYYILHYRLLLLSLSAFYLIYSFFESPYVLEIFWLQGLNNESYVTKDYFNIFITVAESKYLILFLFFVKILACLGLLISKTTRLSALVILIVQIIFLNLSEVSSPEIKYLNYLLMCIILIDTKKLHLWGSTRNHFWMYDRKIFNIFGFVTLLSYSVSGFYKFLTPNWQRGEYLPYLFTDHHLLRPIFDFFPFQAFYSVLSFVGYFVIFIEGTAIFFAFNPYSRFIIFLLLTLLQIGILIFLDLGQITLGMLVGHLFLFDVRYLRWPIFKKFKVFLNKINLFKA